MNREVLPRICRDRPDPASPAVTRSGAVLDQKGVEVCARGFDEHSDALPVHPSCGSQLQDEETRRWTPALSRHEAELAAEGTLQMLVTLLYADRLDGAPVVHAELRGLLGEPNRANRPDQRSEE